MGLDLTYREDKRNFRVRDSLPHGKENWGLRADCMTLANWYLNFRHQLAMQTVKSEQSSI